MVAVECVDAVPIRWDGGFTRPIVCALVHADVPRLRHMVFGGEAAVAMPESPIHPGERLKTAGISALGRAARSCGEV